MPAESTFTPRPTDAPMEYTPTVLIVVYQLRM